MFEKILLPVDGSEHSRRAAMTAADLAHKSGGEIVVLHVRERQVARGHAFGLEAEPEARDLVDAFVRDLKDVGLSARGEVRPTIHGLVARAIMEVAREERCGAIVMGTRGLSDWSGLILGSVAHKVLHLAECPVVAVK